MKYLVRCGFTKETINDLKYFEGKNLKQFRFLKPKQNFFIPIISLNSDSYNKIKNNIIQSFNKLYTFRVNISNINYDENKNIYLIIEPKGFLLTIQRIFEEELNFNNVKNYEKLNKYDNFYMDYLSSNKLNINLDNISFPNFLKINSIEILKFNHNYKKSILIESIKLKNI